MIYILWIAMAFFYIFTQDKASISDVDGEFILKSIAICALIIPIWYGIRQCVNELVKIRKLLDKKSE